MPLFKMIKDFFVPLTPFKAFGMIALLCLFVYFPSLFHVARGDQVSYLADMAAREDQGFVRMAIKDFNLNRTRQFVRGDEHLFRPLSFFVPGTEMYLFGYDFKLWQVASILCHLWVIGWLLKAVWLIRPGYFSAGCVAVFAVMTAHMEMVIWHNITSFLIFTALLLMALFYLLLYQQRRKFRYLGICTLALGAAMLIYELVFPYMLLIVVYAVMIRMKYKHFGMLIGSFVLLLMAFFTWDAVDFSLTHSNVQAVTDVAHRLAIVPTLGHTFMAMGWWFYTGILPFKAGLIEVSRMMAMGIYKPWGLACGVLVGSCLLGIIVALYFSYRRSGMFLAQHRAVMVLSGLMVIAVALVLAVGRMNVQDPRQALSVATYYGYFFWIFLLVFMVALVDNILSSKRMGNAWRMGVGVVFVILLCLNSTGTFQKNLNYAKSSDDVTLLTAQIREFIRQHEAEPDFSFFIPVQWPNYEVGWLVKMNEPEKKFCYVQALFPKYFRRDNPKYTLYVGRR